MAQRIIKSITQIGPRGRLYELDARLRPTGQSGALAVSLVSYTYFDRKAAAEERHLIERYPDYVRYRARTGKLLPWIGRRFGGVSRMRVISSEPR